MDNFCGSPFWNSTLSWHTNNPRLTPCFELTALVWTPCIFLWILAPFELYYIRQTVTRQISWHLFNIAKFAVAGLMLFMSLLDLVVSFSATKSPEIYPVHHVAPFVRAITFVLLLWFMYFNKKQGIVSSGTQFMFSLLLFVCAIPRVKTMSDFFQSQDETSFLENYNANSTMTLFALMTIYLIMQCFADKDNLKVQDKSQLRNQKNSPEETASFLRRMTFQWFDPVVYVGYKRPLTTDDMYLLNESLQVKTVEPKFTKYWEDTVERSRRKLEKHPTDGEMPKGSVLPALVKSLGGPFIFAGFLKFLGDLLTFVSPQLLSLLINFASSDEETWKGYLYTAALFGTAVLSAFLNCQYSYYTYVVGFNIRTVLVSAIYRKSLRTTTFAKKDSTVGQIVNLMSIDAQRFYELSSYMHFLWSGPFVIGLSIYFLWHQLGPSVLAGLGVLILFVPFNGFVATKIKVFMMKQMKHKDERLKFMNEILSGIKVIKLYAWEGCFQKIVESVRDKELKLLWTAARWDVVTYFGWGLAPFLVALASFATFVLSDSTNQLDASKAFVSISLFNVLRMPMALFPMMISMSMQAWVSIVRINEYLNSPELDTDCVSHEKDSSAISLKNGTFSWGADAILKDININVPKGKLWAVVGSIGSGKSSLISAILGEMDKISGYVNVDGSVAYVPQVAWIQNATLQDNIIFGQDMKRGHYKRVIDACALRPDIDILTGGDQTEIGEKGINLSGGQKQRVSLARAVYRKAEIYLFDDPLSAVDAHVGKHIFDNIIGQDGVLNKTTRILVTHALSYLPFVDNIVVLQNGKISEIGSYNELMRQKGPFSELVQEQLIHQRENVDEEHIEEDESEISDTHSIERTPLKQSISIISSSSRKSSLHKSNLSLQEREMQKSKLVESEESATGKVGLGVYYTYFKNTGWHVVIIALIINALQQSFSVYTNIWLSRWVADDEAHFPENRDMYLGIYASLGAGQGICNLISSMILAYGCLAAAKTIHGRLLNRVLLFPMSFFDKTPLGRVVNRFSKDIDTVDNVLAQSMRAVLVIFCSTIAILIVISIATPIFITVVIPIGIVYYLLQQFYLSTSRQLKRIESVTRSPIFSHFGETITGQTVVRAFSDQQRFILDSEKKLNLNQACLYPSLVANRWLQIRLEIIGSLVVFFAALFATLSRGSITGAIVGLSISYSLQITQTLNFLVRMTTDVEMNIVSVERIDEYSKLEQEPYYSGKAMEKGWPEEGKIRFDNLSVSYKEGGELVLKKISFDVKAKEKIGIVGRTGAGKSSLTLSLFRIIEAAEGRIEIDDIDISKISLYSLRSRLTIIPQDPVMFSGTLRMNLDPHEAFSDVEIWEALEHSHLKTFVTELPAGLSYILTEGGDNLSVGQRQLICLARALLRKTKILVLDEATAAVDLETDSIIQKTIQTEFKDCTVLTIAHRINTIMDSTRIIVLDKGMVAEYDTPDNLMANSTSIFYGMAKDSGIVRETSQL